MTQVALVVGGSSLIGAAIASALGASGHEVVLWGRDRTRLRQAAQAVTDAGGTASWSTVDVRDRPALTTAVDDLTTRGRLTAVVWAVGRFDWADTDTADPDVWDQVFDVNLTSAAYLTRLVMPSLIAQAPSALVYLGSGASRQAHPHNAAYVSSKHGLRGLAEAVWSDVRDRGVKVSTVSPGLVAAGSGLDSPAGTRHPEQLLQVDDVAAAVSFVVDFPARGCPTEIRLEPQRTP